MSRPFSLLYTVLQSEHIIFIHPIVFVHLNHFHVLTITYIGDVTISLTCNLMYKLKIFFREVIFKQTHIYTKGTQRTYTEFPNSK